MVTNAPSSQSPEHVAPMNVAQPRGRASALKTIGWTTGLLLSSGLSYFLIASGSYTSAASILTLLANVSAFCLCAAKLHNMRTIFAIVEDEVTAPRALAAKAPKPKAVLASAQEEPEHEAPRKTKVVYPTLPPSQKKGLPPRPNAYRRALAQNPKGGSLDFTV